MPNCCFNPIHGYWTQQWLQIPYSGINGSINEVCTKCHQTKDTTKDKEIPSSCVEENSKNVSNFFKNDPRDYYWFGRCKMDRLYDNPINKHLRSSNPCRHRGTMSSLNNRCTLCTPEFMKFFLLSPDGSAKRCFYQPVIDDPFEKARLTDANNMDKRIPFMRQDLDNRVGQWYDSNFDEYGNPVSDVACRKTQQMLLRTPRLEHYLPYENLDKDWLNNFCEFYREVVGEDL